MDIVNLLTFVFVATLLVISPGPNGVLVAKTVPISGRKAGFANVWGLLQHFMSMEPCPYLGYRFFSCSPLKLFLS